MIPWTQLGIAEIPNGGGQLQLTQRGEEFSIHLKGVRGELMNSRVFNSEQVLAKLGCASLINKDKAHVLVGGLGMGFTLGAALETVNQSAIVTVAELVPEVVEWNKGALGLCAGRPLNDPRTKVYLGDVATIIDQQKAGFDAILLDVDNGPEGFTHSGNHQLYGLDGLAAIHKALRPNGMLAVWSAWHDPAFSQTLKKAKFKCQTKMVRARVGKGSKHTIYLAQKRD
jgi:spermidine synthase